MKTENNASVADDMTKEQLSNTLGLLLNCEAVKGQFMKMSLPALRKVYEGINSNLMAFSLLRQQLKESESKRAILSNRLASFEKEISKKK